MCVVIDSKVIISNAYYAFFQKNKQYSILDYKYVDTFKKNLYKKIVEKYKYVLFSGDNSNCIDIQDHFFIKESKGIRCLSDLDDCFIERVNSVYSDEIKQMLQSTREEIEV